MPNGHGRRPATTPASVSSPNWSTRALAGCNQDRKGPWATCSAVSGRLTSSRFPAAAACGTHGEVKPAGVADLLMVRQQLTGYERADVAHIENVLKGERKEREHTTKRQTEEITFLETEV